MAADPRTGYSRESIESAWQDPEFHQEPEELRIRIMDEMDPTFRAMSGLNKRRVLSKMYSQFGPKPPAEPQRPPNELAAAEALAQSGLPPAAPPDLGQIRVNPEEAGLVATLARNPFKKSAPPGPVQPPVNPQINPPAQPPASSFGGILDTVTTIPASKPSGVIRNIARPGPAFTQLSPAEEIEFNKWVSSQTDLPFDPGPQSSYDMRGLWRALKNRDQRVANFDPKNPPPEWETPYHPDFSNKSIFAGPDAPKWMGERLVDSFGRVLRDKKVEKEASKALSQKNVESMKKAPKPGLAEITPGMEKLGGTPPGIPAPPQPQMMPDWAEGRQMPVAKPNELWPIVGETPPAELQQYPGWENRPDVAGGASMFNAGVEMGMSAPGGALSAAGDLTGSDRLKSIGAGMTSIGDVIKAANEPPPVPSYDTDGPAVFANPNWWASTIGNGIGSMAPLMMTGMGTGAILERMIGSGLIRGKLAETIMKYGPAAVSGLNEGILSGGSAYNEAKSAGASDDQALEAFAKVASTTAATAIPAFAAGAMNDALRPAVRTAVSPLIEGAQEVLQGRGEDWAKRGYDPNAHYGSQDVENFVGGAFGGAMAAPAEYHAARDEAAAAPPGPPATPPPASPAPPTTSAAPPTAPAAPPAPEQAPQAAPPAAPTPNPASTPPQQAEDASNVPPPPPKKRNPFKKPTGAPTIEEVPADVDPLLGEDETPAPPTEAKPPVTETSGPDFETAAKEYISLPGVAYDRAQHKSIADLVFGAQHEIDLYEENDSDLNETQIRNIRKFVKKWGGEGTAPAPQPQPPTPPASTPQTEKAPEAKPDREFSSTQVNLPGDVANRVRQVASKIADADLTEDGRENEPHVTVKFGLHTNDAEELRPILAGEPPVKVKLGKVSLFENKDADVVKIDIDSADLQRLNAKIAKALPHTDTHPDYIPHLTLAYVKPGTGKKYLGLNELEGQEITIPALTFSGKDRTRVEIPLGESAAQPAPTPLKASNSNERNFPVNGEMQADGRIAKVQIRPLKQFTEIIDPTETGPLFSGTPVSLAVSREQWQQAKKETANENYGKRELIRKLMTEMGSVDFSGPNASVFDRVADNVVDVFERLLDGKESKPPVGKRNPFKKPKAESKPAAPAPSAPEVDLAGEAGLSDEDLDRMIEQQLGAMGVKRPGEPEPAPTPAPVSKNPVTRRPGTRPGMMPDESSTPPPAPQTKANPLDEAAKAAEERLRNLVKNAARGGQLNAGIDPTALVDLATIGAHRIINGALAFKAWAADMVERFKPILEHFANETKQTVSTILRTIHRYARRNAAKYGFNAEETPNADDQQSTSDSGALEQPVPAPSQETEGSRPPGTKRDDSRRPGGTGAEPVSGEGAVDTGGDGAGTAGVGDTAESAISGDYRIPDNRVIRGGPDRRYEMNVAAIKLLRQLEKENRPPSKVTDGEKRILASLVGWGAVPQVFEANRPEWAARQEELKSLLSKEEYDDASRSTTNAHYTGDEQVDAMWKAIQHMGAKPGMSWLEPSVGIGTFFGRQPESLVKGATRVGFDKDSITGKLAKYLYPEAKIEVTPFEQADPPKDYFDFAIGNVPFGNFGVHDPAYRDKPFITKPIHNYFFARSLESVRPGGVVAFVTSRFTMDAYGKAATQFREWMDERADFLGAVRLPTNAFMQSSGTHVITDIIFLRKRAEGAPRDGQAWKGTGEVTVPIRTKGYGGRSTKLPINEYYLAHPENVLGTQAADRGQFSQTDYTVEGKVSGDELAAALTRILPADAIRGESTSKEDKRIRTRDVEGASGEKVGAIFADPKGKLYRRSSKGEVQPLDVTGNAKRRIVGQIAIRDSLKELLAAELADKEPENLGQLRKKLNETYDAFYAEFGALNWRNNVAAFDGDPDLPLLLSLEREVKKKEAKKQKIFTARVLEPARPVETVSNSEEALTVTLNEEGSINWKRMEQLTGKTPEEMQTELAGLVFQNPADRSWQIAEEYLSGKVRKKLKEAERLAKIEPKWQKNVDALKKVQPTDIEPHDIAARLGVTWVPRDVYEQFVRESLGLRDEANVKIHHADQTGAWILDAPFDAATATPFKTGRVDQKTILEAAFENRRVKVWDHFSDGTKEQNIPATAEANAKIQEAHDIFTKWLLHDDATRSKEMAERYNEAMNDVRLRTFDGSHLTLPGKAGSITLFPHQKAAIWRMITQRNTLLAHTVGAGKTFEMIAGTMELRRMGLVKRPMFVVPNATLPGWQEQFGALYPNAKVIVLSDKDLAKDKRRKTVAKIATSDFDAVVMPHSSFGLIKVSDEMFNEAFEERKALLLQQVKDAEDAGLHPNRIKQIETANEKAITAMQNRRNEARQDDVVNWEQLGIDMLLVDEAHAYKKLGFSSKMGQIAGIDNGSNQKTFDLHMKAKHVQKTGRGVVFATGTPVTNTMGEMYNLMRYLIEPELQARGMSNFDDWAANFGRTVQVWEPKPEGGGYHAKDRFARFVNIPELATLFRTFADVVTSDMLEIPRPKVVEHQVVTEMNEAQQAVMEDLQGRAQSVRSDPRNALPDNMLAIFGDAQKMALDVRFLMPNAPDSADSRLNKAADNIFEIWDETKDKRSTQLVFADMGVPETAGRKRKDGKAVFPMYDQLIQKLVERGIPREEIEHIYSAKSKEDRANIFDAVNEGKIRVLLGSTEKLGVGVNVQRKLVAMHHLDLPHRPSDIEQRNGRGHRQGNENPEIHIWTYLTKATLDELKASTLARKAKYINQMLQGNVSVREVDDIGGIVASFETFQKLAAADPRVPEMMELEAEVARLEMVWAGWQSQQRRDANESASIEQRIPAMQKEVADLDEAIGQRDKNGRVWEIDGKEFKGEGISDAVGKAAREKIIKNAEIIGQDPNLELSVGSFGGFELIQRRSLVTSGSIIRIPGLASVQVEDVNEVGVGFVAAVEAQLRTLDKRKERALEAIEDMRKRQASIAKNKEAKWPFQEELDSKFERLQQIRKEMGQDKGDEDIGVEDIIDDSVEAAETEDEEDETSKVVEELIGEEEKQTIKSPITRRGGSEAGFMAPDLFTSIAQGLAARLRGNPTQVRPNPEVHQFPEDVEARFQRAGRAQDEPAGLAKRLADANEAIKGMFRVYQHLGRDKFGDLIHMMKRLEKARGIASAKSLVSMVKIIGTMEHPDYELFRKAVIAEDLLETIELYAEQGDVVPEELAFGFTPQTLKAEQAKLQTAIADNPKVAEALEERKRVWAAIKTAYIGAMKAAGEDVSGKLKRQHYYRHRVLMQKKLDALAQGGAPEIPKRRSFLKRRDVENVGLDYATNFIETEMQVMTQLMIDTQMAKFVGFLKQNYDELPRLKELAKARNVKTVMPYFQSLADAANAQRGPQAEGPPLTAEDMFRRTLNRQQAIAIEHLGRLAAKNALPDTADGKWADTIEALADGYLARKADPDADPTDYFNADSDLLGYAAWVLKNHKDSAGGFPAASLFKGIRKKQKTIEQLAGDEFVTWKDIIPETHKEYAVDPTKAYYSVFTIPEHLAIEIMEGEAEKLGIGEGDIRKAFAKGKDRDPLILPLPVVKQFQMMEADIAARRNDVAWKKAYRAVIGKWKQYMLHAPQRIVKYMLRNQSGDVDSMIAGLPWGRSVKNLAKNARSYEKEVRDYFGPIVYGKLRDAKMSPELEKFAEFGPFQNLLSVYETGDSVVPKEIQRLSALEKGESDPGKRGLLRRAGGAYAGWMHKAGQANDWREAMNRYVVYRIFLEDIRANKGKPSSYSASLPAQIDKIQGAEAKAYQMQNDLMGAYDELSVAGRGIRTWFIPFWSYQELNFRRYARLFKNGATEGKVAGRVGKTLIGKAAKTPYLVYNTGRQALKVYALWALLNALNALHDDDDKKLRKDIRQRPHLTFGSSPDGKEVIHFTRLGNISDLLEWFDIEEGRDQWNAALSGRKGYGEAMWEAMRRGPLEKVFLSAGPQLKYPIEAITGRSFYPDVSRPRPIEDWWEKLANDAVMGDFYKAIAGKPKRKSSLLTTAADTFIYRADALESAYYDNAANKSKWKADHGLAPDDFTSMKPKAIAMRNIKRSLRMEDEEAFGKYLREYIALGGTPEQFDDSIERLHPLFGLRKTGDDGGKSQRDEYIESLTPEDKARLDLALDYYNETFLGATAEDYIRKYRIP